MAIWVDADACPNAIKQIIFRAAIKRQLTAYCVANKVITVPTSPHIKRVLVQSGFDKADQYIIEKAQQGDLVITADILLADSCVTKGMSALNPRGQLYTPHTIKQALAIRHLNESLRETGLVSGGPPPINAKDIQAFSQKFDKIITSFRNRKF